MNPHDLYGLPLDRFTPERNALAKQLRGEGRREEAARVGELRRPSVAAWAVNQLVRTQRREVEELFDAGDALQRAQSDLVAGRGQSGALRDASERERAALDQLLGKARGLLSSEGRELTGTTVERVSETLHAAALDDDARAQVKDGCLHHELRHVGLGAGELVAAPARPGAAPKRASKRDAAAERDGVERLRAAKKAEAEARRAADRAARSLKDAEQRRDRAAQALEQAEARVRETRERAEETARVHLRARRDLDRSQPPTRRP